MTPASRRSLVHVLVLAALAVLGALPAVGPAQAAPTTPQLSIGVDDGQTGTRSGSTLHYAVTVTNLGGKEVHDLVVSQSVPTGTKLASVGSGGTKAKGGARWTVDVPSGRSVTLQSAMQVGEGLPADLLRLASVACAATSAKAAPTVCGSDSDQLPAGAAAAEQQHQLESTAVVGSRPAWLLPVATALGLVVAGVLVALVVATRRRKRTAARSAEGLGLPRRGAGPEDVAGAQPGTGELLQR